LGLPLRKSAEKQSGTNYKGRVPACPRGLSRSVIAVCSIARSACPAQQPVETAAMLAMGAPPCRRLWRHSENVSASGQLVEQRLRFPQIGPRPEFLSPRARENRCFSMCRTALALRSTGRKRHAIRSRRGCRLVQWTAGRRRSRRDSRLIVKTSPRFTVNWPALASSILEDSGPVFKNRRCGAISPVRSVPDPPASTAPRAREGIKTHAPWGYVIVDRRAAVLRS
jgi:hypothetical protein